MATTDKANFGLQLEAQTFGRACEAHDLKRILTDIADQIADADQRHSEALVVMQQRLAALGSEAKTIRQNAPEAMAPAIARIEDRMAVLSDRLADSDDSRRSTQDPAERALHTTSHDVFAADPPMALRSASAADGLGSFTSRKDGASRKDGPRCGGQGPRRSVRRRGLRWRKRRRRTLGCCFGRGSDATLRARRCRSHQYRRDRRLRCTRRQWERSQGRVVL